MSTEALHFAVDGLRLVVRAWEAGVVSEAASLRAPLGSLLSCFHEAPADGRTADIAVSLFTRDARPPPERRTRSFFHASLRVAVFAGGWLLEDGERWATVIRAGDRVEVTAVTPTEWTPADARLLLFFSVILALREQRRFHVHAGLVEVRDEAWLIVGPSGAGKSTTTILLARAGCVPLADDAVLVTPALRAVPLARAFHVHPGVLERFPDLHARARPGLLGKLDVDVALPRDVGLPVGAILTLVGPGEVTRLEPCEPAIALGRFLEESVITATEGAPHVEEHLETMSRLVSSVPTLELRPGPELFDDPASLRLAIDREIARHRASEARDRAVRSDA